jgi:hypothetical protein
LEEEMSEQAKCEICGEPMPKGEEMFKFHGYSGPCPKPPLPAPAQDRELREWFHTRLGACLNTMVLDLDLRGHGQYLRDLYGKFEEEVFAAMSESFAKKTKEMET